MSANDGGPAFPQAPNGHPDNQKQGMTLRDYFAAKTIDRSIQAIAQFVQEDPAFEDQTVGLSEMRDRAVQLAFSIAYAMLKERTK